MKKQQHPFLEGYESIDSYRVSHKHNLFDQGCEKTRFDIFEYSYSQRQYIYEGSFTANGFNATDEQCIASFERYLSSCSSEGMDARPWQDARGVQGLDVDPAGWHWMSLDRGSCWCNVAGCASRVVNLVDHVTRGSDRLRSRCKTLRPCRLLCTVWSVTVVHSATET